ncbi:hypothetical protein [Streptomyces sp. N35]|uniref:hypothetical protein n=1 Tax=Streptomyces sp. N35 TaxID=2795730 RepID=UPI0018F6B534|nr:hypothetical protein [Streptomyces sp. N35]
MPRSVQAARVLVFVLAAFLAALLADTALQGSGPLETAGVLGRNVTVVVLFVLAMRFAGSGNGIRTAATVATCAHLAVGVVLFLAGRTVAWTGFALSFALLALLTRPCAVAWFKRPRTPERLSQGYAAS